MTVLVPSSTRNLAAELYDLPTLDWATVEAAVAACPNGPKHTWFLTTVDPDGRPHTTGIGHIWHDGAIHFATGPAVRKTRNLLADSRCSIAGALEDYDVVFDGDAERVTDPGLLAALVAKYNAVGWPAEVEGDAITAPYSAPSAGPAPWHLYRFTIGAVTALKTSGESGATKWRFR
jgi:hypothetical protein